MSARTIMFQGTGSDVGKSVLNAALCRILARDGYRVAPFKSQNMALNSFITKKGKEIGRAQAVQAEAAMVEPTVDMNPVLLKPNADNNSQVIFRGEPYQNMTAKEYFSRQTETSEYIKTALDNLSREYEVIVIEGGGSPAEINLKENDLVNMKIAEIAEAPVILIADIDKGGVFASIVGTLELLEPQELARVKGIIVNKFRGDISRFESGVEFIEEYTGKPVLGVIPFARGINIPDEDSVYQKSYGIDDDEKDCDLKIAVIYLPHISNFTDFDSLACEEKTKVKYVKNKSELGEPDMVIIPGSKNTIEDLESLYQSGLAGEIKKLAAKGKMIVGICGGFQMLGKKIKDPFQIESEKGKIQGLDLLDMETAIEQDKVTSQVKARLISNLPFTGREIDFEQLAAYEIHMGKTERGANLSPIFEVQREKKEEIIVDGAVNKENLIWGTYLHGLFDNDQFRYRLINYLREKKGLARSGQRQLNYREEREKSYNKFAELVREHLDLEQIYSLISLEKG